MKEQEFRNWLLGLDKMQPNSAETRISNCRTVENSFGNLDDHYIKDRGQNLLTTFTYSTNDRDKEIPPKHNLNLTGDVHGTTANLKHSIKRYMEFRTSETNGSRDEKICFGEQIEVTPEKKNNFVNYLNDKKERSSSQENTLLLLPIRSLSNKKFVIESYQRGYKWGKKEILELLNDIDSYDQSKGLYCLQPFILKPIGPEKEEIEVDGKSYSIFKKNEVVDGQQRSTTLYLLLKYLHYRGWIDNNLFDIEFLTRKRSGEFLSEHLESIYKFPLVDISHQELKEKKYHNLKSINQLWEQFIEKYRDYDNVDIYHFFTVTSYLIRWIEIYLFEESKRNEFIAKLVDSVKVIWYSLDLCENDNQVIKVFLNNNKGKIGLTSSELIKAVFILYIKNSEPESVGILKINQFASEWDIVEQHLQDDSFWYFIQSDESLYKEGTRIDYLFDLLLDKPKDSDAFFAYRYYESMFNNSESVLSHWDDLIQLYYKLLNWFNDSEIFHFVGFLINSKIKTLKKLLEESNNKSKEEFKYFLKKTIKQHFSKKYKNEEDEEYYIYSIDNLSYDLTYDETLEVLLLYNVYYYLENMAEHKFPFHLFVKEKWSIEHIVPQNPKDIQDINIYYQWFKDIIKYGELPKNDYVEKISSYSDIEELKKNRELWTTLQTIIKESEDITHSLNNLLLLDRNTNSSLSNSLFGQKRNKVLKFDKDGVNDKGKPVFIPIETLNAFNKTFSNKINIENWTKEDGDNYIEAIQIRLREFLPKVK